MSHCCVRVRWRFLMLLAGGMVLVTILLHLQIYSHLTSGHRHWQDRISLISQARHSRGARNTTSPFKLVLMHSFPYFYELKAGAQHFSTCDDACVLTLDSDLVDVADGVVVYSHWFRSSFPKAAKVSQTWVYFAVESPVHSNNDVFGKPQWHHRFNWTMTYRRDSDFYFGYGDSLKIGLREPPKDLSAIMAGKSKMVAWFVSHCQTQSKREDVATALQEFVPVDVYGYCGKLHCERGRGKECLDMLSKDYYFYLSMENSLCKDYLSEKVYHILKHVDIIPVVWGGANYSALLPPNSFIDAAQFPSIRALAEHLMQVAGNKALYQSYLAWKNTWQVNDSVPFAFCELCHRLHHPGPWDKVYSNVDAWWRDGICHEPPPLVKT